MTSLHRESPTQWLVFFRGMGNAHPLGWSGDFGAGVFENMTSLLSAFCFRWACTVLVECWEMNEAEEIFLDGYTSLGDRLGNVA